MNDKKHKLFDPVTDSCELSIIMPCLNEAKTVGVCVQKAKSFIRSRGINGEVIVADNGSTDGSQEIAERCGARVIHVPVLGYGSALMAGIEVARGRYLIIGDADDSYDFTSLELFIEKLHEGYDLVMGNRFKGGIKPGAMPPLHRYFGNPLLSWVGRLFFKSPVRDFHCGLRGFRRNAIQSLQLTTTGMEFASEMVVKATLRNFKITEVPTTLSLDGRSTASHLRSWRDGWRHLRFLLLFSPRWLFLYPGILFVLIGVVTMICLLQGPRRIGSIGFDVNTLVYSGAGIICGFQAIVFAVLAKYFAIETGLLPQDLRMRRFTSIFSLEIGIIAGLTLLIGGLLTSAYAIGFWGKASFGPLDAKLSLRIVVPAATAMVLGMQLLFFSFFLSILRLERR